MPKGKALEIKDIEKERDRRGKGCAERWKMNCDDGQRIMYKVRREFLHFLPEKLLLCETHRICVRNVEVIK